MDYLLYCNVAGRKGSNIQCELLVSDDSFGLDFPNEFVWTFSDGETRFLTVSRPGMNTKISRKRCLKLAQALLGLPRGYIQALVGGLLSDFGSYAEVAKRIFTIVLSFPHHNEGPVPVEYLIKIPAEEG